jgi:hypothetical protein
MVSLLPVLGRLKRGLGHTAADSIRPWVGLVWLSWMVNLALAAMPHSIICQNRTVADIQWYLAAVLALTPPIAILGARRPTSRVWTWFVVIPLVFVFSWPVVAALRPLHNAGAFTLEEPIVVGYVLVLVMGAGNYIGLRFSLSAFLWIAGNLLIVLPLCPATAGWAPASPTGPDCGALCLIAAGWLADRQVARRNSRRVRLPLDGVWSDFRDLFGIVWARRVQERFNEEARRSGAAARLGMHGLEDAAGNPFAGDVEPTALAAAETSLRWLLQKFVEPAWIDARLKDVRL